MPGMRWINDPTPNENLPPGPYPDVGGGSLGVGTGFPVMDPPIFRFGADLGRMPIADAEALGRGLWLVSARAKELLEKIDAEAFSFLKAITLEQSARPGPSYWLCDVVRILDALDPEQSVAMKRASGAVHLEPKSPWDGVFLRSVVEGRAIFRLKGMPRNIFCNWNTAEALQRSGLTGFRIYCAGDVNG